MKFRIALIVCCCVASSALGGEARRPWAYNGVSVDIPLDGGAMVSYQRTWALTKFLDAGIVASGGQIKRDFELKTSRGETYDAKTDALILPMAGPYVTLHWNWIGISLGYGAYWAKTDLTVENTPGGTLRGQTKGWGSGIYSPLLVLDLYDEKRNLVYGFGLGGFFGLTYPDMTASSPTYSITTDASPIDTLTFHVRCLWADGRWKRGAQQQPDPF